MATQVGQGLATKIQQSLVKFGFYPGSMSLVWDPNTISELERYWAAQGWPLPRSAAEATELFNRSFRDEGGMRDPDFSTGDATVIGLAYAEAKGFSGNGWLKKNWIWLAVGIVVVAGGAIGGYLWYKRSEEKKGLMGELGEGDCGCSLGHSGRTTTYSFPTGKKRGHYRSSTGRFHEHS